MCFHNIHDFKVFERQSSEQNHSSMVIIDCHAHLTDDVFYLDLEDVISSCEEKNIHVISVGMNYQDFPKVIELSKKYSQISFGLGLHPIQAVEYHDVCKGDNFC